VLAAAALVAVALAAAISGAGATVAVARVSRATASGAAAPSTSVSAATASGVAAPDTDASAAAASGTGASATAASGVAEPDNGAPITAASGTTGLAEVAAPEVPVLAVAPAVAAEALVAWAPADEPAMVEELLGRGALAIKRRSLQQKAEHLAQGKRAE